MHFTNKLFGITLFGDCRILVQGPPASRYLIVLCDHLLALLWFYLGFCLCSAFKRENLINDTVFCAIKSIYVAINGFFVKESALSGSSFLRQTNQNACSLSVTVQSRKFFSSSFCWKSIWSLKMASSVLVGCKLLSLFAVTKTPFALLENSFSGLIFGSSDER